MGNEIQTGNQTQSGGGMMQVIPVEMLKRGVMVVIGDWEFFIEQMEKNGYKVPRLETKPPFCMELKNDVAIFMSPESATLPRLVHELVHAAKMILDQTDIKDEEMMAYLVEYLTREVTSTSGVLSRWTSDVSRQTSSSQSDHCQHCDE